MCIHAGFRVAHLLQLLIGYVGHDFDILMEQQDINQLKVMICSASVGCLAC